MTRGLNQVQVSGNVSASIVFGQLPEGKSVATFVLVSEQRRNSHQIVVRVKVNVYVSELVELCRRRLQQGAYIIVEGELMNRLGEPGELLEVRARDILFVRS